jgi:hypothetical protein
MGLFRSLMNSYSCYNFLGFYRDNKNYHDGQYLTTGKIIPVNSFFGRLVETWPFN